MHPHGGAAGSGRTSVWHSPSARSGAGVRVRAAAAALSGGRHQHPGAGEGLPEGREHHPYLLLPESSTQTHLVFSGNYVIILRLPLYYESELKSLFVVG